MANKLKIIRYIELIKELHFNGVSDPIDILTALLNNNAASTQVDANRLFTQNDIELCKAIILRQHNFPLTANIESLDDALCQLPQFNKNGDVHALWTAFFYFYPMLLVNVNKKIVKDSQNNNRLKESILKDSWLLANLMRQPDSKKKIESLLNEIQAYSKWAAPKSQRVAAKARCLAAIQLLALQGDMTREDKDRVWLNVYSLSPHTTADGPMISAFISCLGSLYKHEPLFVVQSIINIAKNTTCITSAMLGQIDITLSDMTYDNHDQLQALVENLLVIISKRDNHLLHFAMIMLGVIGRKAKLPGLNDLIHEVEIIINQIIAANSFDGLDYYIIALMIKDLKFDGIDQANKVASLLLKMLDIELYKSGFFQSDRLMVMLALGNLEIKDEAVAREIVMKLQGILDYFIEDPCIFTDYHSLTKHFSVVLQALCKKLVQHPSLIKDRDGVIVRAFEKMLEKVISSQLEPDWFKDLTALISTNDQLMSICIDVARNQLQATHELKATPFDRPLNPCYPFIVAIAKNNVANDKLYHSKHYACILSCFLKNLMTNKGKLRDGYHFVLLMRTLMIHFSKSDPKFTAELVMKLIADIEAHLTMGTFNGDHGAVDSFYILTELNIEDEKIRAQAIAIAIRLLTVVNGKYYVPACYYACLLLGNLGSSLVFSDVDGSMYGTVIKTLSNSMLSSYNKRGAASALSQLVITSPDLLESVIATLESNKDSASLARLKINEKKLSQDRLNALLNLRYGCQNYYIGRHHNYMGIANLDDSNGVMRLKVIEVFIADLLKCAGDYQELLSALYTLAQNDIASCQLICDSLLNRLCQPASNEKDGLHLFAALNKVTELLPIFEKISFSTCLEQKAGMLINKPFILSHLTMLQLTLDYQVKNASLFIYQQHLPAELAQMTRITQPSI